MEIKAETTSVINSSHSHFFLSVHMCFLVFTRSNSSLINRENNQLINSTNAAPSLITTDLPQCNSQRGKKELFTAETKLKKSCGSIKWIYLIVYPSEVKLSRVRVWVVCAFISCMLTSKAARIEITISVGTLESGSEMGWGRLVRSVFSTERSFWGVEASKLHTDTTLLRLGWN